MFWLFFIRLVSGFESGIVSGSRFSLRQGLFFGFTTMKCWDCQAGERGSIEDGLKAQIVFRHCGRSRFTSADRIGSERERSMKTYLEGFCCN